MNKPTHTFLFATMMVVVHAAPVTQVPGGTFQPPQSYLEIQHPEYGGGPLQCYTAKDFSSITPLIEEPGCKVIWAIAEPPTTATKTVIGGLFVLSLKEGQWTTTDAKRFEAAGKDSNASASLTSSGSTAPHITVTLHQGGRGAAWEESASYVVKKGELVLALPDKQQKGE